MACRKAHHSGLAAYSFTVQRNSMREAIGLDVFQQHRKRLGIGFVGMHVYIRNACCPIERYDSNISPDINHVARMRFDDELAVGLAAQNLADLHHHEIVRPMMKD